MSKLDKETEQGLRFIMDLIYATGVKKKDHSKLKNILIEQIEAFFSYEIKNEREKVLKEILDIKSENLGMGKLSRDGKLAIKGFKTYIDYKFKKEDI